MMSLIKIFGVLFEVVQKYMDYLKEQKLREAGKLQQANEASIEQEKRVDYAKTVTGNGPVDRSWLRRKRKSQDGSK